MPKHCIRTCSAAPVLQVIPSSNEQKYAWDQPNGPIDWPPQASIVGRQVAVDHEAEWTSSRVDPVIVRLNVQTLVDQAVDPYSHEVVYPIADRLNWRVTRANQSARPLRGWWVSGVDPLNEWQTMGWGRFKPDGDTPVVDRTKGKAAKYLSPSLGKGSSRLVLLDVPFRIWQAVAERYGKVIVRADMRQGFWAWVQQAGIPIVLTEGEKKAGCLLTAGYAAISLPGIFGGYRREGNHLIPELAAFCTGGRSFYIAFDHETKPQVQHSIFLATSRLGQLLTRAGSSVKVVTLPGPEKGVDDFIVAQGAAAFDALCEASVDWSMWQAQKLWALTYPADLELNDRYLGEMNYPETGLVCVKSPKGTGKTTALKPVIDRAIAQNRKVLVITHRIQLGKVICKGLGLDWIGDVAQADKAVSMGYGLCVDSLHGNSQAKFDPYAWEGAIVVLDEIEQVLWHALNSSTCYSQRVKVLETLKELLQFVLRTGGLVVAQDADLSDVSVDYLQQMAPEEVAPWVVVNHWQNVDRTNVSIYDTKTPAALLTKLDKVLDEGAVFVALDSQKVKGRWSSKNLETYFCNHYPEKKVLRIDSETVADPEHPAWRIADRLNDVVQEYDIILATPTIGTGVSIDLKNHFAGVFGIFQGVVSDSESRQALARVRDEVPRYVWSAKFGPGKIGNGSCFYRDIAQSTAKLVKYNIMLLKEVDFDLDQQTDPVALRTWAKMAARVNLSLWQFRDSIQHGLSREGHDVAVITDDLTKLLGTAEPDVETYRKLLAGGVLTGDRIFVGIDHDLTAIESVQKAMTQVRSANQKAEAIAVANSDEVSTETPVEVVKDRRSQTTEQRRSKRKQQLQDRYPVEVTPELMLKDEAGWYEKLLLHYYATHDPMFVQVRDLQEWRSHLERGGGKVALQDVNLLTAQVEMLKAIGVVSLLDAERRTRVTDAEILRMVEIGKTYRQDIRLFFGIKLTDKTPPMTFVQALLAKMDVKLTCVSRDRMEDGRRGGLRVYRYFEPEDNRVEIFQEWDLRDSSILAAKSKPEVVSGSRRFVKMEERRSA
jgi:Domain of unknown function (DUF3854)